MDVRNTDAVQFRESFKSIVCYLPSPPSLPLFPAYAHMPMHMHVTAFLPRSLLRDLQLGSTPVCSALSDQKCVPAFGFPRPTPSGVAQTGRVLRSPRHHHASAGPGHGPGIGRKQVPEFTIPFAHHNLGGPGCLALPSSSHQIIRFGLVSEIFVFDSAQYLTHAPESPFLQFFFLHLPMKTLFLHFRPSCVDPVSQLGWKHWDCGGKTTQPPHRLHKISKK